MEQSFCVYGHYKFNEIIPFYIGKGIIGRAYQKTNRNKHWHNIVNKYGYRVEIMYDNLTEAQAFDLEKEFIKRYGRADLKCGPLVNMTDGGEGQCGYIHSKETKQKMSICRKEYNPSLKTKLKISKSMKGKNKWSLGVERTEATKMKISKSHIGVKKLV